MARWSRSVEPPAKSFLLCVSTDSGTVALRFCLAMFKSSPREPELTSQTSSIVRGCDVAVRAYCALSTGVWRFQLLSPPLSAERWRGDLESERVRPSTCIYSLWFYFSDVLAPGPSQVVATVTVLFGDLRVGGHCYVGTSVEKITLY